MALRARAPLIFEMQSILQVTPIRRKTLHGRHGWLIRAEFDLFVCNLTLYKAGIFIRRTTDPFFKHSRYKYFTRRTQKLHFLQLLSFKNRHYLLVKHLKNFACLSFQL